MLRRTLLFTLLALCTFTASADRYDAIRQRVEASMLVTGELVVAPDGTVKSYTIDRADALPPETRRLITEVVPTWELDAKQADGSPLRAPTAIKMSMQLLARPIAGADDQLRVTIQGAAFRDPNAPAEVEPKKLAPPEYPVLAAHSRMTGTVYVVLRLNPDGTVAETHVEQVDMTVISNEKTLLKFSKIFAKAAVDAAKQWTFNIAPERLAKPEPVEVRVPLDFLLVGSGPDPAEYGRWRAYLPGAYAPIPWRSRTTADGGDAGGSIGAMVPGQFYPADAAIKLRGSKTGI